MTHPIDGVRLKMCVIDEGSRSLSCGRARERGEGRQRLGPGLLLAVLSSARTRTARNGGRGARRRTGTFFCVMTTETPAPRMASDVWPEVVIALNAYSAGVAGAAGARVSAPAARSGSTGGEAGRTDLVEPAFRAASADARWWSVSGARSGWAGSREGEEEGKGEGEERERT